MVRLLGGEDPRRDIGDIGDLGEHIPKDDESNHDAPPTPRHSNTDAIPCPHQLAVYPDRLRDGPGIEQPGSRHQKRLITEQGDQTDTKAYHQKRATHQDGQLFQPA